VPSEPAGGERVDVLLIFPPQTEARFFPYLSLPYLTGHLRGQGRRVHQADLNIELLHDLLRHPEMVAEAARAHDDATVDGWYRRAMADVVARHIDEVRAHVMEKSPVSATRSTHCAGRPARNRSNAGSRRSTGWSRLTRCPA
jgi:anaerobic magnesium-protoporphyrin IX monomethyl ester cyclase